MNETNTRYWRIAPGRRGFLWAEQRDNNCIAVGWNDMGNLTKFRTKENFEKQFKKHFSKDYGGKNKKSI